MSGENTAVGAIDPVALARAADIVRGGLERHRRELAEYGECRTCAQDARDRAERERAS